jgi:hypothetical protein
VRLYSATLVISELVAIFNTTVFPGVVAELNIVAVVPDAIAAVPESPD